MHWLLKTEPATYSFDQLLADGETNWNGVRNFQARNYLRQASPGDPVIIYHSGDEKRGVGSARVVRGAYADPDPLKPGDWVQIDIRAIRKFARPVTLQEIRQSPKLSNLPLIRQPRLSCMPITEREFTLLIRMGGMP